MNPKLFSFSSIINGSASRIKYTKKVNARKHLPGCISDADIVNEFANGRLFRERVYQVATQGNEILEIYVNYSLACC